VIPARQDPSLVARITSSSPLPGVRAGSALLSVGPRLLVAGDDAHAVGWLNPASGSVSLAPLAGDGRALPKLRKPDFEAAAAASDGSVWLFGSGSLSNRCQLVRLSGPDHTVVTPYDGTSLFAALADHLGVLPNIERALFVGETLRLFHRETGPRPDVLLDLAAYVVHGGVARVRSARTRCWTGPWWVPCSVSSTRTPRAGPWFWSRTARPPCGRPRAWSSTATVEAAGW
jgi:Family of unknown function (DUF6929)